MKRGCFYDRLTVRQVQIAKLIVRGETNGEIAERFGCSKQAITQRVRKIFDAVGVWNRVQLAVLVDRHKRDCRFCKAFRESDVGLQPGEESQVPDSLQAVAVLGNIHQDQEDPGYGAELRR